MTDPSLDVLCIGNAIVDVIADADDAFLAEQGLDKGSMRLIDEAEAVRLYGVMGPGREVSGGSAGNTAAGLAALGIRRPASSARSPTTSLGTIYKHDIEAQGVDFLVPARGDVGATARCLILVTPDAQRTMNTFLGAAQRLEAKDVDLGRGRRRRHHSISKAICGTRPSRARRWRRRSTPPTPPAARSPSLCPTASASTRHRDSFLQADRRRPDRHPVRQ